MDGDVAPLAGAGRARRPPPLHAGGRRGARHRRARARRARRRRRRRARGRGRVIVGTLGKALGGYGAYVCGSRQLVELLINTARPFIYSTAPPPPSVGAALAALGLLEQRPGLVEQLRRNAATLRECLSAEGWPRAARGPRSCPVIVGDARRAMALCERTLEAGVFAQAIRPPTVPAGELAAAAHGDGQPSRPRSCTAPRRRSRGRRASSACGRPPASAGPALRRRCLARAASASRRRSRARPRPGRARGDGRPRRPRSGCARRACRGCARRARSRSSRPCNSSPRSRGWSPRRPAG